MREFIHEDTVDPGCNSEIRENGVSYFTDGGLGNSQTRLVNTRRLVFTGARELSYKCEQTIDLNQPLEIYSQ